MAPRLKGRIVEIKKNVHQVTYVTTGIKKKDQWKYRNFPGSNGTVVTGSDYNGTTIDVKILVYDYKRCVVVDIRDYILQQNGMQKVSSKLLNYVVKHNKGKKVVIEEKDGALRLDLSQLNVKMP
ncbi:hypothetical protein [Brevibacillus borstelensis]|uniref:hypothetical protein n=1 Tax=Brevibacillus borstelensis TaxID=45462 RepID=UPI002E1AE992|nr:hypothetical protein [Brevibacillus borstelensis]